MAVPFTDANRGNLNAQTPGNALLASEQHPSRLPLSSRSGQASVVFLSQLIPANFSSHDRSKLLEVLRSRGEFIPTCIVGERSSLIQTYFGNLTANADRLARLFEHTAQYLSMSSSQTSPRPDCVGLKDLSPEVFDQIAQYLARKDIQSLLSTCKRFNHSVAPLYFRHIVLPFGADAFQGFQSAESIGYPIDGQELPATTAKLPKVQGSHEAKAEIIGPMTSQIQPTQIEESLTTPAQTSNAKAPNPKPDMVLNMFRTWGAHVSKFAFALEFDQGEQNIDLITYTDN